MITQSVIMSVLIGIVITGVVPCIGGIVLLAAGKIKGSSFWAGVLAYIISMIASTIIVAVMTLFMMDMVLNNQIMFGAIGTVVVFLCMVLAMGICEGACMKTNSFIGAMSCGLGFGVGYAVTAAISFISMYVTSGMINSGEFDRQYAELIGQGFLSKEQVNEMKSQYTAFTVPDIAAQIIQTVAFAMVLTAAAVFIMRGKCTKNLAIAIIASVMLSAADMLSTLIPNLAISIVVPAAIGIAALIFAVRMKDKIVEPETPVIHDSFLESIEKVQNDDSQE